MTWTTKQSLQKFFLFKSKNDKIKQIKQEECQMTKANFGVVGMAVMGRNLALNIESRGYTVAIYNRSKEKTEDVIACHPDKNFVPSYDIESFVNSIEKPRRIMLMVQAGPGTDATIQALLPPLG